MWGVVCVDGRERVHCVGIVVSAQADAKRQEDTDLPDVLLVDGLERFVVRDGCCV
jgi:hypothetical protein